MLIGLIVGAGLVAWSERFRNRGYVVFSYSLKAIGSGVLYLSLWAAFSLYHLVPAGVAFAAMVLVTAFNGFMAWVQDAELLALYAIVGGVSTPLLLSTGENHEATLFTYLLVIDIAVLVLVALRPWSRLLFMAFLGSALFYVAWSFELLHKCAGSAHRILPGLLLPHLCLCAAAGSNVSSMTTNRASPDGTTWRSYFCRSPMRPGVSSAFTPYSTAPALTGRRLGSP